MTYLYQVGGEVMRMHDDECVCPICSMTPASEGFIHMAPPMVLDPENPEEPARTIL